MKLWINLERVNIFIWFTYVHFYIYHIYTYHLWTWHMLGGTFLLGALSFLLHSCWVWLCPGGPGQDIPQCCLLAGNSEQWGHAPLHPEKQTPACLLLATKAVDSPNLGISPIKPALFGQALHWVCRLILWSWEVGIMVTKAKMAKLGCLLSCEQ